MGKLSKIIKENEKGEIFYDGWVKCKHIQKGITHCEECLSVDNRWFYAPKSPKLPHHPKCHCVYETILTPTLKDCKAECDVKKFTSYIFAEKGRLEGNEKIFLNLGFTIKIANT